MKEKDMEEVKISHRTGKPIDKEQSERAKKGALARRKRKVENWKKSPVIGMNGYDLEKGDNTNVMMINIALFNMEDIDMYDIDQVNQRLGEFFALYAKHDYKPTVAGMALCLNGMSRQTLLAIVNDRATGSTGYKSALPPAVTSTIKKAFKLLENMWETYMNSGKINPVAGVFFGVNNYKYRDVKQVDVTPIQTEEKEEYSVDEIKKRYLTDGTNKESQD